tara:strand:- start:189 stop:380 length:192 start_codon:yes stop_codon:yes gene_type:complete
LYLYIEKRNVKKEESMPKLKNLLKNIEVKDVKKRDPFWSKLIHYVHKNKKKYNRKPKHKNLED